MKRFMIIFALLIFVGASVQAQDRTVDMGIMDFNQTLIDYTGVDADTLTANQDTIRYSFRHRSHQPVLYNVKVQTTETSTITGDFDVVIYGKVYSDDDWTEIASDDGNTDGGSVSFVSDLSAEIDTSAASSAPFYRYFMIELDGSNATALSAGKMTLNSIYVKLYRR